MYIESVIGRCDCFFFFFFICDIFCLLFLLWNTELVSLWKRLQAYFCFSYKHWKACLFGFTQHMVHSSTEVLFGCVRCVIQISTNLVMLRVGHWVAGSFFRCLISLVSAGISLLIFRRKIWWRHDGHHDIRHTRNTKPNFCTFTEIKIPV